MKPVNRSEILELGEYEKVRDHFRARVIREKKARRLMVGPNIMVLFENHDTVLLQIQEMLRTERITRESSVLHEIETYNALLGGTNELGATVMIEIADPKERDEFLVRAKGVEQHFVLKVGDVECRATWDQARVMDDQASAVMYVKFALNEHAAAALRSAKAELSFIVDHPAAPVQVSLPREVALSLVDDVAA
jgi:hypothetical protein